MDYKIKQCLDNVRKPARYTGGEYNQVVKDKEQVDCRFALCFPELYEIAMSHLGSKILYGRLNAMEGVWCERMYAPAPDMEREMRRHGVPLYGLSLIHIYLSSDEEGTFLSWDIAADVMVSIHRPVQYEVLMDAFSTKGGCTLQQEPLDLPLARCEREASAEMRATLSPPEQADALLD